MFMLYAMQTNSELVCQCQTEWRSVCNAVMESYTALESKPAKSIKILIQQVQATFVSTVQKHYTRSRLSLVLYIDGLVVVVVVDTRLK